MFQLVLRKQFVKLEKEVIHCLNTTYIFCIYGINFVYTEEDQNPIPDEFFSEGVLITSD
jgi:hypothetical protein